MAQVTVGEGVGAVLEPDNDGVQLADGPDSRMVDIIVYHVVGDHQTESRIDRVCEGNEAPGRLEGPLLILRFFRRVILFLPSHSTFSLLRSNQLDDICNDEVTWHEREEDRAEKQVVFAVVMAFDTDEDSILRHYQHENSQIENDNADLDEVFNNES
jgi:hypothetical protein